jgi:hypothetical protein
LILVPLTRLNNFTRVGLDEQLPAAQMSKNILEPAERFSEGQGMVIEEVIALYLEFGVLLMLKDKDYVSSDRIRLHKKQRIRYGNRHTQT